MDRKSSVRDDKVKAAFDRFHATASTNRKAATSRLHTDMTKAGGPVPSQDHDK